MVLVDVRDLVQLVVEHPGVVGELLLRCAARPLIREAAIPVGDPQVDVSVGRVGELFEHLERIGSGVLRTVLRLRRDGPHVHPLDEVVGGHAIGVEAVEQARCAAEEFPGVGAEVDGETAVADLDRRRHGDARHGERSGSAELGGVDVVPYHRHVAIVAVGVRRPSGRRQLGGDVDHGARVECVLDELFERRRLSDELRDLRGGEGVVEHLDVIDRSLQQRIRVEGFPDVAGVLRVGSEQFVRGGVGGSARDRHTVEVRRHPPGCRVEGRGDRRPFTCADRTVPRDRGLTRAARCRQCGGGIAIAVRRRREQVPVRVSAEVEDALPGATRAVPAHARRDREGVGALESAARDRHVSPSVAAGEPQGGSALVRLDELGFAGESAVEPVTRGIGDDAAVDLVHRVVQQGRGRLVRRGGNRAGPRSENERDRQGDGRPP